ncbi:MAG TPA: hypothetical protein VLB29_16825 [Nocardioidaceae bacterium]|nr:hypothetical protein [Nocardioidaceae bacterium]
MNLTLRRSVAAAVLLVPVLASCGFNEPTDRVYTPGVGVNERSGTVDVLHALIVSGAEGSGTVVAGLSNNDRQEDDALTRITGAGDDARLSVTLDGPVEIPAGGAVQLVDETEVSVEGETVEPGTFVELTFTFERGENVTVEVPVVARRGDYAEIPVPSIAPTPAATEEEEHSSGH